METTGTSATNKESYMTVAVFDTETTGLVHRSKPYNDPSQPWPVQIALSLFDDDLELIESWDTLVKLPKGVFIQEKAGQVHGITHRDLEEYGRDPMEVLEKFKSMTDRADITLAYNLDFDKRVMGSMISRLKHFNSDEQCDAYGFPNETGCIMIYARNRFCVRAKDGTNRSVKLAEAYKRLYGVDMSEVYTAHDAVEDTLAARDVFKRLLETA